ESIEEAAEGIARVKSFDTSDAAQFLLKHLEWVSNDKYLKIYIQAIADMKTPSAMQGLLEMAQTGRLHTRQAIIRKFGELKKQQTLPLLIQLAQGEYIGVTRGSELSQI